MITIETTGKTVEEAVDRGLEELGITKDEADVEIIEEPAKAFLGIIGGREARVKITKRVDPMAIAREFLEFTFDKINITVDLTIEERKDHFYVDIKGKNIGILIGRRGETLDALQYLTNLVVQRKINDRARFILDIENYRDRREETLIRLANKLYEKAKRTQKTIKLEPMNPHERRIIHTALQNKEGIQTFSEGEEPYRKVVIAFKR